MNKSLENKIKELELIRNEIKKYESYWDSPFELRSKETDLVLEIQRLEKRVKFANLDDKELKKNLEEAKKQPNACGKEFYQRSLGIRKMFNSEICEMIEELEIRKLEKNREKMLEELAKENWKELIEKFAKSWKKLIDGETERKIDGEKLKLIYEIANHKKISTRNYWKNVGKEKSKYGWN